MAVNYSNGGALALAKLVADDVVTRVGTLRLFNTTLDPTPGSTPAQFGAAGANFSGYAPVDITAFLPPFLDPLGGASIILPTVQFSVSANVVFTDIVAGWYIALPAAGGEPEAVLCYGQFDSPIPMQQFGQSIPINLKLTFGA